MISLSIHMRNIASQIDFLFLMFSNWCSQNELFFFFFLLSTAGSWADFFMCGHQYKLLRTTMRIWCFCTKILPDLREVEPRIFHSHVMEVSLELVSLFLEHSEDGLIHTYITFQVSKCKNFLDIYTYDLNELSPKLQHLYLTFFHPTRLGVFQDSPGYQNYHPPHLVQEWGCRPSLLL